MRKMKKRIVIGTAAAVLVIGLAVLAVCLRPQARPLPAAGTEDYPVLRLGDSGEAAGELNRRLNTLGYGGEGEAFSRDTLRALLSFQRQNGLDADGIAGKQTWTALLGGTAVTAAPTVTPPPLSALKAEGKPYEDPRGLPLLVNRSCPLPENYQPLALVLLNDYCDPAVVTVRNPDTYAEKEAADALIRMLTAACEEGIFPWQISSAYRTPEQQQAELEAQAAAYRQENDLSEADALSAARKTVALPGTSEHHLGTCFDITVPEKWFAGTDQYRWMAKNCWDYGFILRYAADKEEITGFLAEAWHYRYVGREIAQAMRDANLCLEEFLQGY